MATINSSAIVKMTGLKRTLQRLHQWPNDKNDLWCLGRVGFVISSARFEHKCFSFQPEQHRGKHHNVFLFMAMPWLCFFHLLVRLWFHISWLILLWPLLKGRGLRGWSRSIRLGPHWTSCWSCDASAGRPGIEIVGSSRPHRCSVLIESGKEMTLDWTWTFRVTVTCGKLDMAIGCEVYITFSLYLIETQKVFQTSGKLTWIALNFLLIICTILSISFGVMGRVLDCSLRRFMTWVVNSLQPCSYFSTSWNWHTKKIDINHAFNSCLFLIKTPIPPYLSQILEYETHRYVLTCW